MINSRLLHQFIAVAEELHFGRAAERIPMAQSPLSQAIQKLEAHVGTPLFRRSKRRVSLTPAGKTFLEEAYQWLQYEELVLARTRNAGQGLHGHLSIGFTGSTGYELMPTLIEHFRQFRPLVQLRLLEMTTLDQLEHLKTRNLDVGLLRTPLEPAPTGIATQWHARDRLVAALPARHPLAARPRLAVGDLRDESFVAFSREKVPAVYRQLLAVCESAGFLPAIAQECRQVASLLCSVAAGVCVALVQENLTALRHPKVVFRPLTDTTPLLEQELSVAWRRDDDNPALAAFLQTASRISRQPRAAPAQD